MLEVNSQETRYNRRDENQNIVCVYSLGNSYTKILK